MGRMPDAHAIRRTKDKAVIIPETVEASSLTPPETVLAHPHMTELWSSLVGSGIAYEERDIPLIEQLVWDFETVEQCRARVMGADGQMKLMIPVGEPDPDTGEYLKFIPNPYLKQMREAMTEGLKLADQLGLSPMARARLGLTQAAGKAATLSIAETIDALMEKRGR